MALLRVTVDITDGNLFQRLAPSDIIDAIGSIGGGNLGGWATSGPSISYNDLGFGRGTVNTVNWVYQFPDSYYVSREAILKQWLLSRVIQGLNVFNGAYVTVGTPQISAVNTTGTSTTPNFEAGPSTYTAYPTAQTPARTTTTGGGTSVGEAVGEEIGNLAKGSVVSYEDTGMSPTVIGLLVVGGVIILGGVVYAVMHIGKPRRNPVRRMRNRFRGLRVVRNRHSGYR